MSAAFAHIASAPRRFFRGARSLARFVAAALRLFDTIVPRFRVKTALVVMLELVGAIAGG